MDFRLRKIVAFCASILTVSHIAMRTMTEKTIFLSGDS